MKPWVDTYYGIGVALNSREMRNKQFAGQNMLGKILEDMRDNLTSTAETDNSQN